MLIPQSLKDRLNDPLTAQQSVFAGLAGQTLEAVGRLGPSGLEPIGLPGELAERAGLGRQSSTRLWGFGGRLRGLGQVHATVILGPKAEIVNAMIYPQDPGLLPVFATEVVRFGTMIRVAFVDVQPLDRAAAWLDGLQRELQGLRAGFAERAELDPDLPGWLEGQCSGGEFLARSNDLSPAATICEAWMAYLGAWIRRAEGLAAAGVAVADSPAVAAYKHHHVVHSPGLVFLGKFFGEEWTRRYMSEFMYGSAYDYPSDS